MLYCTLIIVIHLHKNIDFVYESAYNKGIEIEKIIEVRVMDLKNILHQRQYKIVLSPESEALDLSKLQFMGIWSKLDSSHYLLTIKPQEDKFKDSFIFESKFREITGLSGEQANIEPRYGPLTFQRAVDSPWF